MSEIMMKGIAASPGRAAGKVWLLEPPVAVGEISANTATDLVGEVKRLEAAVHKTDEALVRYKEQVLAEQGEKFAEIFEAHRMILQDPAFVGEAINRIQSKSYTAETALQEVAEETMAMLKSIEDPYFQERAVDVQDVTQQLLQNLVSGENTSHDFPAEGQWIVLAEELTPAQTISLPKDRVLGFGVLQGGKTSHAAILARTYGIPAVVGIQASWSDLASLECVELDGDGGSIQSLALEELPQRLKQLQALVQEEAEVLANEACLKQFVLAANISRDSDLTLVTKFKAQGVGLFRTEFLFMGSALPTEEEQFEAYRNVIAHCTPHLTIIRTLDIGGDKKAPALNLPTEKNPFLGVRALRLCLKERDLFMSQLRAIWRASAFGATAVMFPMIATVEELRQAKALFNEAKAEVLKAGHEVGEIQIGTMIEIPAAAWISHKLAAEVDFFSIGTNDLIQYSLAVDRENNELSHLYQPYHPAVLGMIAKVAQAAQTAGIWTGICGESGGDRLLTPFFAALGIKELSMSPGLLPKIRQRIAEISWDTLEQDKLVASVLDCSTSEEVVKILSLL